MSHLKYREEKDCLNCGALVEQKFCPQCGQENLQYRDNFVHMSIEVVGDFFHFDSKFFRSLKPLFSNPGFLTGEYLAGKRVKYIQPIRLFFFSTIIMVIVAGLYYKKFEHLIVGEKITTSDDKHPGEERIASEKDLTSISSGQRKLINSVSDGFEGIYHNLKYISFILLPVYALIFMLFYRKSYYVDHLIYVLHVQSFVYIVLTFLLLIPLYLAPAARDWFGKVMLASTIVYICISLRYLFQQSWRRTILKGIAASGLIIIVTELVIIGYISATYLLE